MVDDACGADQEVQGKDPGLIGAPDVRLAASPSQYVSAANWTMCSLPLASIE
jgi:hypothetical protein